MRKFQEALHETFLALDQSLLTSEALEDLNLFRERAKLRPMVHPIESGCTANVILLINDQIICANAGDSRSVLKLNDQIIHLSEDHKPELEREKTRILREGGSISAGRVNGRINLTRGIGDLGLKKFQRGKMLKPENQIVSPEPDIRVETVPTGSEAVIVMGCDGIWECLSSDIVLGVLEERCRNRKVSQGIEQFLDAILAENTQCNNHRKDSRA